MLEQIETYIGIAVGIISIIGSIWLLFKNKKIKTVADITSKIPSYVSEAEEIFGTGTGAAKLSYVINKVQIDCVKASVKMTDTEIKAKVEEILATPQSKTTNEIRTDVIS